MTTSAHPEKACAAIVEPRKLCWLVDASSTPLGFIRDNRGGAFIVGGATGSHYTGHTESWWDKLCEIGRLGYIPVELAMRRGLISGDWSAPELLDKDAFLVKRIQKGEI
jgi:hypothetical protein